MFSTKDTVTRNFRAKYKSQATNDEIDKEL